MGFELESVLMEAPNLVLSHLQHFYTNAGYNINYHWLNTLNQMDALSFKATKQIIINNISPDGSLHNDEAAIAAMQYHITPILHLNVSPGQLQFHRVL